MVYDVCLFIGQVGQAVRKNSLVIFIFEVVIYYSILIELDPLALVPSRLTVCSASPSFKV